jgi:hypothetical protein
MRDRPFVLFGAAGVQAVEAAVVCVASVLSAVDTAAGKSYQLGSGIALTVIGFATVAALGWVAVGLAKARPWSWTPAMLVQLFTLIIGIYLLQSRRYDWGTAAVVLPLAAAVLLLLPGSLDLYGRKPSPDPAARPEGKPAARPGGKLEGKPAARPGGKPEGKPAARPGGKPTARPNRPRSGRP